MVGAIKPVNSRICSAAVLAVLVLAVFPTTPVSADLVWTSHLGTGLMLIPAPNASMPSANVTINIDSSKINSTSVLHAIHLEASFEVISEIDQNATIAFVAPAPWALSDSATSEAWTEIQLLQAAAAQDNASLDIQTMSGDDMNIGSYFNDSWMDWLRTSTFLVFEVALQQHEPTMLDVWMDLTVISNGPGFVFRYYIGTARTWIGNTIERVQITVEDHVPFLDYYFYPTTNLTKTATASTLSGSWSFDTNSFDDDSVEFGCQQFDATPPYYVGYPVTILDYALPSILAVLIGVVVILIVRDHRGLANNVAPT